LYGSEDDDVPITKKKPHFDGSEDDVGQIMKKKPRNSLELKIAERVSERNKRSFASLNENNIKLIYLRRSLIINLLNHPDTFDQKVVGCFVRVKNAPKVHIYELPKKPYQLGLVTGKKEGLIASILSYP
jgi:adenosine/AMP kinase